VASTRKDALKKQVEELVGPQLRANEDLRGGALGQTGPLPGLFGLIGMLFIKQYFVVLTTQRVIFVKSSQLNGRPTGIDFEDARDGARAEAGAEGRFWSSMTYYGSRTVKLRYHKLWREEMNVILHALGGARA
jgi:hypothetical protein